MHLPDGILAGHTEAIAATLAVGGLAVAGAAARRELQRVPVARIAAVGGLIFAGQMVNVPVASGTSGHLLGAALAVALLGPGLGIVTTTAVLVVQALLFADGGVSSLGANVLNMAVVPGLVAAAVLGGVESARPNARLAAAAGVSTLAAAVAFTLEYAVGALGGDPVDQVGTQMLAVHVPIAAVEVALTLAAVAAIGTLARRPERVLAGALLVAVALAPWASSSPDGLERVAIDRGFASLSADHTLFGSPLADYATAGIAHPAVTVALAGAIGVLVVATLLASGARLARVELAHR